MGVHLLAKQIQCCQLEKLQLTWSAQGRRADKKILSGHCFRHFPENFQVSSYDFQVYTGDVAKLYDQLERSLMKHVPKGEVAKKTENPSNLAEMYQCKKLVMMSACKNLHLQC